MPILIARVHNILQNIRIARDVCAGHVLSHNNGPHGVRMEERARALECLDCNFAVRGVRELVGIYEG
jgi:hypothetical protein